MSDDFLAKLSPEALELLCVGAADKHGTIFAIRMLHGFDVKVGERNFVEPRSPRSEAKWQAVVRELAAARLIEAGNAKQEWYSLTEQGYQTAEAANRQRGAKKPQNNSPAQEITGTTLQEDRVVRNVLLVGCEYTGRELPQVHIDNFGLCRRRTAPERAAPALYDYDVIIINVESYSHFLFGRASKHSTDKYELHALKAENNNYDLDNAYDFQERCGELASAISHGACVVWLIVPKKEEHFFGMRSVYDGCASASVSNLMQPARVHEKGSKRLSITGNPGDFAPYFEQLKRDGWYCCVSGQGDALESIAVSPEGHSLGGRIRVGQRSAWLLTAPQKQSSMDVLIQCALGIPASKIAVPKYHGLFLSHTGADKIFVRTLKSKLNDRGVKDVWVDEAEIMIGDSLMKKIAEGVSRTRYFGVVLSPRSIKAPWVERELEIAMNREISSGEVTVLPLLYEKCDLPAFLSGKLYADFTSPNTFEASLDRLLDRLRR